MGIKWKYVLGTTTIVLIVGGTVYAIVKSRQALKSEEESISVEEAKEIVEARKAQPGYKPLKTSLEMALDQSRREIEKIKSEPEIDEDIIEEPGTRVIQGVKASLVVNDNEEEEELEDEEGDDPLYDKYERVDERTSGPSIEPLIDFSYYEDGINPKEDKVLRYEPNSVDARHQFIRMELADWEPNHDVYQILLKLFEYPFMPTTDGDDVLKTQIIEYKVQFFGYNSRWNKEVSFADIILHYARGAEFNCGESVAYWAEYFLDYTEFYWDSTSQHIDTHMLRLNSHTYFNEERATFGLFGLSRESMDQAIMIANRNIDRSVTYEIEFNEFLKSIV